VIFHKIINQFLGGNLVMKKFLRTLLVLALVLLPVSVFHGKEASAAQYDF